jgi:hypothetical protein
MCTTINTLTFDFVGRDLSELRSRHQRLLSVALDDLPLADSHKVLADMVRANGSNPFVFRIPDDYRLLAAWQSSRMAAVVATYWRRKLAHIDLIFTNEHSPQGQDVLDGLPLSEAEIASINASPRPLLAMVKVRRKTVGLAEVMGMIAYLPSLDFQSD